jgi:hypothetical protein
MRKTDDFGAASPAANISSERGRPSSNKRSIATPRAKAGAEGDFVSMSKFLIWNRYFKYGLPRLGKMVKSNRSWQDENVSSSSEFSACRPRRRLKKSRSAQDGDFPNSAREYRLTSRPHSLK